MAARQYRIRKMPPLLLPSRRSKVAWDRDKTQRLAPVIARLDPLNIPQTCRNGRCGLGFATNRGVRKSAEVMSSLIGIRGATG